LTGRVKRVEGKLSFADHAQSALGVQRVVLPGVWSGMLSHVTIELTLLAASIVLGTVHIIVVSHLQS
jgi:hypothetical protein